MIVSKPWKLVLGVVALLCAGALIIYARTAQIVDTNEMQARQDLRTLREMLERFKQDHGRYPTQSESLDVLVDPSPGGRYVVSRHGITDPWGNVFVYRAPDSQQKNALMIYSRGPNGLDEGGRGDDIVPRDE